MIYTITVDFDGIKKSPCLPFDLQYPHIPHFWYDPEQMRRCFCRGDEDRSVTV